MKYDVLFIQSKVVQFCFRFMAEFEDLGGSIVGFNVDVFGTGKTVATDEVATGVGDDSTRI